MRTRYAFALLACLVSPSALAQSDWLERILKQATEIQPAAPVPAATTLSQDEIARGLKEALAKGAQQAITELGKDGGYLNNAKVKIPIPERLRGMERAARALGQGRMVDAFVTSLNHAAEQAVPEAAAIVGDAITQMTLEDARAILKGPDDAATQYFRKVGEARLSERFRPIVTAATDKAGVTAAYKRLARQAGPMAQMFGMQTDDLDGYVTTKALDGLFLMIAAEEKRIRENPVARTTDLLKKVFGATVP